MSLFDKAVEVVLREEGGYVNDPHDPGGETNFGISKRSYPHLDIKTLTKAEAIEIYRQDFWEKGGIKYLESAVGASKALQGVLLRLFSFQVNMGIRSANKCLQRALVACGRHLDDDGIIGSATVRAFSECRDEGMDMAMLAALRSEAACYYRILIDRKPRLAKFARNWLSRAYR